VKKAVKLSGNDGKPFTITIDKFGRAVMTLYDDTRLPLDGVSTAQNMYLDQDGVWSTRPPTTPYGAAFNGVVDGADEFVVYNTDGTATTYMWIIDNGAFRISQDGGAWTTKTGVTWTIGKPVLGLQVNGIKSDGTRANLLLLFQAGTALSYYDISGGVLGSYSSIGTPAGLGLTRAGLIAGGQNAYYRVTAVNAIGETLASTEASVAGGINKTRDNWISGTDSIALAWTAVSGASRYNIYYSDVTGGEVFLGSSSTNAYTDTGVDVPNPYVSVPDTDTTGGPKYGDGVLSGNRVWATKDPTQPYRTAWTGTGQYMGAFNPFYGGGYIDLEKGGPERPEKVIHFRTGKGDGAATVLSSSPNGSGSTTAIQLTTLTVDTLVIVIPVAVKQQGSVGTRSPLGVVEYDDSVYFPSPKGFHNTGSRQSILNVLVTSDLSDVIRPTVRGISNAYASQIAAGVHDGRIYWAVPYGSSTNNQILVHDVERKGAWALPWTLGVKRFFEYTDSGGVIHFLAVPTTGTKLIEIGGNGSGDSGTAFQTILESGIIHFDKNHMTWAYVAKAYVELADPAGDINFGVSGTRRGKSFNTIKTRTISAQQGSGGFGADLWADILFGDTIPSSVTYAQPSIKKVINIKKVLNNIKVGLNTNSVAARYSLIQWVIVGTLLPTSDPSDWKK
jgi:hypothetical protein